ncbi:MAG: hypothetical protein H0T42_20085 [Deltaproteobacteria bacterium]|nr:hypothetical protein [Deltaproteobacteria bacterium]
MRAAILVLGLAACDRVLGLHDRLAIDASPVVDAAPITSYIAPGDYDDDGIPNESDACPLRPDQDNSDSDSDGLADECDPDLGAFERDCIVLLDYWNAPRTAPVDLHWLGRPAPWTNAACDGSDTAFCSPPGSPAILYFDAALSVARVELELRIPAMPSDSRVMIFRDLAPDEPDVSGRGCGLWGGAGVSSVDLARGTITSQYVGPTFAVDPADDITLAVSRNGECTAHSELTSTTRSVTNTNPPLPAGARVGIRLTGLTAHLHYVIAYGEVCP